MAAGLPDKDFKEAAVSTCSFRSREMYRRGTRSGTSTKNFRDTFKKNKQKCCIAI